MSDARAMQARELHRRVADRDRLNEAEREQRDRLIVELRDEDPARWTYGALAAAVGCSPELVAAVVKGRTRQARRRGDR